MDSISFSPIFSHFSGVLAGLVTVRAFRQTPAFALRNVALLNQSNRCWWPLQVANRWLATRLETLGVLLTFITAVLTGEDGRSRLNLPR